MVIKNQKLCRVKSQQLCSAKNTAFWLNPCLFPFHTCRVIGFYFHTLAILKCHNDCGTWTPARNAAPWHKLCVTTFVGFFVFPGITISAIAKSRHFFYPTLSLVDNFLFLLMPRSLITSPYCSVPNVLFQMLSSLSLPVPPMYFFPSCFSLLSTYTLSFHSSLPCFHQAGKTL